MMGIFGFGKKKEKPAPAAAPKPAPAPETPETLYQNGMTKYALRDHAAAFSLFRKAAEQGHGKALLQCAEMYARGEGVEKDLRQALELAEKAKAQGVEGAEPVRRDIATQYVLEDVGGWKPAAKITAPAPAPKAEAPKPAPAPRPAPAPAAQDGPQPGEADYQKGEELRRAKDYDGVIAAWTKAAEQGHREALKKLTGLYAGNWAVWGFRNKESRAKYMDYDKAIQWGTAAMERGVDVVDNIMKAYEKKGQIKEAIAFGEKAVSQGFDAEWKLMYLCIDLGKYEDAVSWGQKYDGKKGTNEAKERLAQIEDEAVDKASAAFEEKDYSQALSFCEKAAGLGNSAAMFNCGLMYDKGDGTAVDKAKALMWYKKAAEQGNVHAQFNCGRMYNNGEGTAIDKAKAVYWYSKAAEQGDEPAKKILELMRQRDKLLPNQEQIMKKLSQKVDLTFDEIAYVRENYERMPSSLRSAYDAYMLKLIKNL